MFGTEESHRHRRLHGDLPRAISGVLCSARPVPMEGHPDRSDHGRHQRRVQSNAPEAIARWIAEFQAIPPLQMSAEEATEWQAARQAQRELELKTFDQRADQIQQALPRANTCSTRLPSRFASFNGEAWTSE